MIILKHCGEEKPRCGHCVRYNVSCVYPQHGQSGEKWPSEPSATPSSPRPQQALLPAPNWSPPMPDVLGTASTSELFDMKDLALMHQWSVYTSSSIIEVPWVVRLWQTVLPQLGFAYPFLIHGLMSISALHLAHQNPSQKHDYILEGVNHHNKAIQGFREAISEIDDKNCHAVFGTATINVFYIFAVYGKLHGGSDEDSVAKTSRVLGLEWTPLIRGVGGILRPAFMSIESGPLSKLVSLGSWEDIDLDSLGTEEDRRLLCLPDIWKSDSNKAVYDKTLQLLRQACAWRSRPTGADELGNRGWSGPFVWLHLSPDEYFDFVRQRQPPALAIFAYFGAMLHSFDKYWWMEGWGKDIVQVVDDVLGSYWNSWLEWPRQVVGLG